MICLCSFISSVLSCLQTLTMVTIHKHTRPLTKVFERSFIENMSLFLCKKILKHFWIIILPHLFSMYYEKMFMYSKSFYIFICDLKGRKRQTLAERGRPCTFTPQMPTTTRSEPAARDSVQVSLRGRGLKYHYLLLPRLHITNNWNWERSHEYDIGTLMWDEGFLNDALTKNQKSSPRVSSFSIDPFRLKWPWKSTHQVEKFSKTSLVFL